MSFKLHIPLDFLRANHEKIFFKIYMYKHQLRFFKQYIFFIDDICLAYLANKLYNIEVLINFSIYLDVILQFDMTNYFLFLLKIYSLYKLDFIMSFIFRKYERHVKVAVLMIPPHIILFKFCIVSNITTCVLYKLENHIFCII